jgi:hypothetical protein
MLERKIVDGERSRTILELTLFKAKKQIGQNEVPCQTAQENQGGTALQKKSPCKFSIMCRGFTRAFLL